MSNEPFDESLLSAYLDGELTPDEARYVEDQLTNSPRLQQLFEEMRILRHWVVEAVMRRSSIDHTLSEDLPILDKPLPSIHEQINPHESHIGSAPIRGPWSEPLAPSTEAVPSVSTTREPRNFDENHRKKSWGLRAHRGPWIAATALAASLLILFLANADRLSENPNAISKALAPAPVDKSITASASVTSGSATPGSGEEISSIGSTRTDLETGNPREPENAANPDPRSTLAAAAANDDVTTSGSLGRNKSVLKEDLLPDIAPPMETTSPTNPSDRRQLGLQARGLEARLAESSPREASPKSEVPLPLQADNLFREQSPPPKPLGRDIPKATVELKQAIPTPSIQTPSEIDSSPKLLAWLEQSKALDPSQDPLSATLGKYIPQTESAQSWIIVRNASHAEKETEEIARQDNEIKLSAVDANGVPSENNLSKHLSAYFFEYQPNRSNGSGTGSPVIDDAKQLSESASLLPQDSKKLALAGQPDTDAIRASDRDWPPAEGAMLVFQFSEDQSEQALVALQEIGVEWPGMDQAQEEVIYLKATLSPTAFAGFTNRQLVLSRKIETTSRASASMGQQPIIVQEADLSIQLPATAQRDADQVATKKSSREFKTLGTSVENNLAKATSKQRRVILVIAPEPSAANVIQP